MMQRNEALSASARTADRQLNLQHICLLEILLIDTSPVFVQMVQRYEALSTGAETVESQLKDALVEHLNAELTLGTIRDVSQAVAWIQTTFMFVRVWTCHIWCDSFICAGDPSSAICWYIWVLMPDLDDLHLCAGML